MSQEVVISVKGVEKVYPTGRGHVYALDGVDLEIYRGEYVSIMGPSGSGKSTLFNMIGCLDRPSAGSVEIGGVALAKLSSREAAYFRGKHLGYIFQAYNLISTLTALGNVALPVILGGASRHEAREQATRALTEVGLEHRLDHLPSQLSGGQQQRTAIARAVVNNPTILLADEPTANLDLNTGKQVVEMIKNMCKVHGVTVITATHDHSMLEVSDRVVWIADGKIERIARRDELKITKGTIGGEEH